MKGTQTNAAFAAKAATPIDEIPADLEIPVRLRKAAEGEYRNQYRGWFDKAGTVRVRVYAPGSAPALRGEIHTVSDTQLTDSELMTGNDEVTKFTFEIDDDDVTVIVWAPTELEFDTVKVLLG